MTPSVGRKRAALEPLLPAPVQWPVSVQCSGDNIAYSAAARQLKCLYSAWLLSSTLASPLKVTTEGWPGMSGARAGPSIRAPAARDKSTLRQEAPAQPAKLQVRYRPSGQPPFLQSWKLTFTGHHEGRQRLPRSKAEIPLKFSSNILGTNS